MRKPIFQAIVLALIFSADILHAACGNATANATAPTSEVAEAIIVLMERRYQNQMARLAGYQARREISATSPFLSRPAHWTLAETFRSPGERTLRTISRDAPKYLDRLLLDPIVAAETETARAELRPAVDLTRANYRFTYIRYDAGQRAHVFQAEPRTEQKYLFRGLIWVDDCEFAVKHIEGSPARKPSVWVRASRFTHEFAKFDDLWLPVHHRSVAELRWFGKATLDMTYSQYNWHKNESGGFHEHRD